MLYLKHAFDESDESLLERWVENPYWQYFCGCQSMQHDLPIDPSSLSRWRQRVGAERLEQLLQATIQTALQLKAVKPYDGHTLKQAVAQTKQLTGVEPQHVSVGQGYRKHDYVGSAAVRVIGRIGKTVSRAMRRMFKRRAAIEPTIGHLKSDNRLCRNPL